MDKVMKAKIDSFFNNIKKGQKWKHADTAKKAAVGNKLYELFIYSEIGLVILAKPNHKLIHKTLLPKPSKTFVFRGAPGKLHNDKRKANSSFLEVQVNNKPVYELHQSLEIIGKSGVEHEMDICIIQARGHRTFDVHWFDVKVTVECKYYKGKLEKSIGRLVLGATEDTGRSKIQPGFLVYYSLLKSKLGRNTDVEKLLNYYDVETYFIRPSKTSKDLTIFQNQIKKNI